jgi:hypothetical protein
LKELPDILPSTRTTTRTINKADAAIVLLLVLVLVLEKQIFLRRFYDTCSSTRTTTRTKRLTTTRSSYIISSEDLENANILVLVFWDLTRPRPRDTQIQEEVV